MTTEEALKTARVALTVALMALESNPQGVGREVAIRTLSDGLRDTESCEIGNCQHQECARERVARKRAARQDHSRHSTFPYPHTAGDGCPAVVSDSLVGFG